MPNDFYTFTPPPGWRDITEAAKPTPQYAQIEKKLRDTGAEVIGIAGYASDTADATILFSSMKDDGPEEMLDGFDKGARGSMLSAGHEDAYGVVKTDSLHVSTQRMSSDGVKTLAVRYAGMAKDTGLAMIAFNCHAPDEATCDTALAALHVDGDKFRPLSDLPSANGRLQYAFGVGVGISAVLIVAAWRIYKSRRVPT